ncbi:MAG: aspartyl/glutamyl-tRNA(Asn/Gln) amidotransferase subunit [Candidatus Saccharibacteria bacterium]|nr:aspartyl/glutamyl-tRNA(Asn/Gln) amidotransferase subunit [Candidatus Saccharibacteria bacterium]
MLKPEVRDQYTTTIGIECHVQLKTQTKLFSAVGNDAREAPANTLVSHIDFGMPGALPVLNQEALRLAVKAAFALGTEPERFSKFDRKHYFYPDLPKGYQISQYDEPIIGKGSLQITIDGEVRTIGITRAHMEEDAGKSTHPAGKDYSLVDLNRAGTPLLEIVSEPDMHSAAEAKAYARELYLRMRYADVSDANLYYGNMRFDVNVSVSKTSQLGTRSETKNLNSFRSVEKAIEYEVNRQIERLEKGEAIVQETRGWDDAKQRTFSQRSKENADDYRYMPDPDIPPVVLSEDYIAEIKAGMPVMPDVWRQRLSSLGLDTAQTETLIDAHVDFADEHYLELLEAVIDEGPLAKQLATWLVNVDVPFVREQSGERQPIERLTLYRAVAALVSANKLSSTNAKALIIDLLGAASLPANIEAFATDKGYIQESDEGAIAAIVSQVIADNPKAAEDVKAGEMKAIGFLTGQVMKLSQGKANPALAGQLIRQQLGV